MAEHFDETSLNLERDVPTTTEDVRVLRELRREVPSWFDLSVDELEALLPEVDAVRRRLVRRNATPFTLE